MKNIEKSVRKFLRERGWDKLRPGDLAKSVSIEAAELLEIFQWSNPELTELKNDPKKLARAKEELADVLIYALDLSVTLGLDTEKIIRDKMAINAKKYPGALMRKTARKREPGTDKIYWRIKEARRKSKNNTKN